MGGYNAADAIDELQPNEDHTNGWNVNEWMSDTEDICVGLYTTKQLISGCLPETEMKP